MKRGADVQLGEPTGLGELAEGLADQGERIAILACDSVEAPVVDTKTEAAARFAGEEHGRACRGGRCADPTFVEEVGERSAQHKELLPRHVVERAVGRLFLAAGVVLFKLNLHVSPRTVGREAMALLVQEGIRDLAELSGKVVCNLSDGHGHL